MTFGYLYTFMKKIKMLRGKKACQRYLMNPVRRERIYYGEESVNVEAQDLGE